MIYLCLQRFLLSPGGQGIFRVLGDLDVPLGPFLRGWNSKSESGHVAESGLRRSSYARLVGFGSAVSSLEANRQLAEQWARRWGNRKTTAIYTTMDGRECLRIRAKAVVPPSQEWRSVRSYQAVGLGRSRGRELARERTRTIRPARAVTYRTDCSWALRPTTKHTLLSPRIEPTRPPDLMLRQVTKQLLRATRAALASPPLSTSRSSYSRYRSPAG